MAMNTTTAGSASAFISSLFASRSPATHTDADNNDAQITDWEFVNNSDLSDDDGDLVNIVSDSESETASTLVSVAFVDSRGAEKDEDVLDFGSIAVVGIRPYGCVVPDYEEKKKESVDEEDQDLVDPDTEEEEEEDENDDLDDELVPWSVSDRFGRQRMRKLGTRAFAKMNKTTKKFAYTVNRPGCVRGKHGLGRKG